MEQGLTEEQAQASFRTYGKNEIKTTELRTPFIIFFSQFPTAINAILAVAGILSLFIGDRIDGIFIFSILLLNAVFGFVQEYKAEKSLQKLKEFITPMSRVIRGGKEVQVPTSSLVPGDIAVLHEGDRVPADGKAITSHHMEIDESILTGESIPVMKRKHDGVFSGTLVVKGKGYFKVTQTGMETKFGQIAKTLASVTPEPTPLQKQLQKLGVILSVAATSIALLLIPIGMGHGNTLLPMVLLAVSVAIAAIPEGLPAVITIALALGTSRMAKNHAIVRKMPSVETLGAVQIILIDKTGTITQNTMRVKKHHLFDAYHLPLLLKACVLGNTATLIQKDGGGNSDVVGDKTDAALLLWAKEQNTTLDALKTQGKVTDEYEFDPQTRMITTIWEADDKEQVFVRGAPEDVIVNSTLNNDEKEKAKKMYEEFAKEGLRVIAFGTKDLPAGRQGKNPEYKTRAHLEEGLTLLGIVGIYDPPRIEAKDAIAKARKAGITPIMVTGDNELTAHAIAKEVGLITDEEDVVTGQEMGSLSDEKLLSILDKTRIFARTTPEDKLRLVTLYQQKGYVVGVTGDGVNDALALKKADIGIAMGEKGTDVAKEASDIILTDDNFATIVKAVEEGRVIYSNIQKALTYLLSGNLAELSLIFFAVLFGLPSPLLPTQILWMNIVTDGLPALALAADTKDGTLLSKAPRSPQTPLITKNRFLVIIIVGIGLAASLLVLFQFLTTAKSELFARTMVFNLLVICHMFLAFFIRGTFRMNTFLLLAAIGTIAVQVLITTIPFFQSIFHIGF